MGDVSDTRENLISEMMAAGWDLDNVQFIADNADDDFLEFLVGRFTEKKLPRKAAGTLKKPIPYELRKLVFERDAYRCQTCGDWHDLSVDHIIPESKGGLAKLDNLQTLCRKCNSKKGNRL